MFEATLTRGQYVRHLREQRGWRQEDLAAEAGGGVVRQEVARFERGGTIPERNVRSIEAALGLELGALG